MATATFSAESKLPGSLLGGREWALRRAARGWVGIDIGASAIKLAQLERRGDEVTLRARWLIPLPEGPSDEPAHFMSQVFAPCLPQVREALRAFRGRSVAATLPGSLAVLRCLELPQGTRDELRQMLEDELRHEYALPHDAARCFGFWETGPAPAGTGPMAQVTFVDVARSDAAQLSDGLRSVALICEVLDAAPCALARAVQLAPPTGVDRPVVAIDLGGAAALMVLAVSGRPAMTRVLRGCGSNQLSAPLEQGLRLARPDAHQLLRRIGIPSGAAPRAPEGIARATLELLTAPLARLASEVRRTLSYWQQVCPGLAPEELVLFGGGALIRNLPQFLAAEVGLSTRPWQLSSTDASHGPWDDALFGVAAALSALAWETDACS